MLPHDPAVRKAIPIHSGVIAYFPDALAEVAKVSKAGNDQHNPGQPLHWAKGKSTDHEDCIVRHTIDALQSKTFADRIAHKAARAWRALADLQTDLESDAGRTYAPNAMPDTTLYATRTLHIPITLPEEMI